MSKRDEILSYCKFYKGEKENPFTTHYGRLFWEQEAHFVHKFEDGFFKDSPIDEALSDYMIGVFEHLSNMHDTMDNGEFFREKYFRTKSER